MESLFETVGVWLARVYAIYGIAFLVLPLLTLAYVGLLGAVAWAVAVEARGRVPWPFVPGWLRSPAVLAVELIVGLVNPVIYLAVLTPTFSWLRPDATWFRPLTVTAWTLLAAFWMARLSGGALNPATRGARIAVRAMLALALACLVAYVVKDAILFLTPAPATLDGDSRAFLGSGLNALRVSPLYLIPLLLLWRHVRSTRIASPPSEARRGTFFILPSRAARVMVACGIALAIVTIASAVYRRSETAARALVAHHRDDIAAAAAQYDVDARLIAAIVYVTNREQLAPFRDELERVVMAAWAEDRGDRYGGNQMLLNHRLDLSVGLAQIKPRTALTASLLARGLVADDLPRPALFTYRNGEPFPRQWMTTGGPRTVPFPVPTDRRTVVAALLDARTNLATCAMILALYQEQWETAHPDFSLRGRSEILATLYQIGFARSRPHGSPRSNAFGSRVADVIKEPWLVDLFGPRSTRQWGRGWTPMQGTASAARRPVRARVEGSGRFQ